MLKGDLQMACEQDRPVIAAKNISFDNGCAQKQAPRIDHTEFADRAVDRIDERTERIYRDEIIRAREIGQREGYEDAQKELQLLRTQYNDLFEKYVLSLNSQKPAYVLVPDTERFEKRIAEVEALNKRQAATIKDYQTENDVLVSKASSQQERIDRQMQEIMKLQECVKITGADNSKLTQERDALKQRGFRVEYVGAISKRVLGILRTDTDPISQVTTIRVTG